MRSNLWWIAVLSVIVLIVWPLETIIGALLVSALVVAAGAYTMYMMRHPAATARMRALDRVMHFGLIGAFAAGVLLLVLWPITAAIAALALALVASAAWVVLDYSAHHPQLASAPAATDEPEFWAEAMLQPTPEPAPPEPVPSDPTPRVHAAARRRPAARARRPGPPSPRTGAPNRARRPVRV